MRTITIDWSAIAKTDGTFRATFRCCPNPDFGEILPRKAPGSAQGTLLEVLLASRAYAEGLGGGNWQDPIVYRQYGRSWRRYARISYNGRLWPPRPWHPGMRGLFEKDEGEPQTPTCQNLLTPSTTNETPRTDRRPS